MFAAERVRYFVFLVLLMCEESYVFVACAPYIEKYLSNVMSALFI